VLEVDAVERRVRLVRPDAFTPDPDMRETPAKKAGRALAVMATAEAAEVEAVVDTGATAILALTEAAAETAGLLDGRETDTGTSIVLGGAIEAQTLIARTVTIGDALYREVTVAIYASAPIPGFPQALVGMEAFAGRRVALELAGPRLWTSQAIDVRVERPRRRRAG
jgi:predicted aspartyl protease